MRKDLSLDFVNWSNRKSDDKLFFWGKNEIFGEYMKFLKKLKIFGKKYVRRKTLLICELFKRNIRIQKYYKTRKYKKT